LYAKLQVRSGGQNEKASPVIQMRSLVLENSFSRAVLLSLLVAIALPVVLSNTFTDFARADGPKLSDPDQLEPKEIGDRYGRLPLSFEPNEGQTEKQVKFLSRGPGYDMFLTATGVVLTLRQAHSAPLDKSEAGSLSKDESGAATQTAVLRLKIIGANPEARVDGEDELPGKINYLIGNDPNKWHVNISTYRRVHYREVYPGVEMVYYGNHRQLEYDFVIAPGADLRPVRFRFDGAQHLGIDLAGDLVISIDGTEVKLRKPVIYQITNRGERHEVIGSYALKGNEVGFKIQSYDSNQPLIIDPVLSYSTYFGPSANSMAIAVDASGSAYLTGSATSGIFPTTAGSLKPTSTQDVPDAFVTKLNPAGTALVYSTFLGGSGQDQGNSIAVDSSGNAYITGDTTSVNFPTVNAIRSSTSNFLTSLDSGAHWGGQFIGPPNGVVNVLAADPLTPTTIYAGMGSNGGGGVYKTTDGGNSWVGLNTGLTGINCPALVVDPTTPSTLYASLIQTNSGTSGLYKSVDAGGSWTKLSNGLSGVTVSALAIDPSSPSTVYAGASFLGLFKSTNGGASWTNSSTGINFGGTAAIAVDPANSAIVYAAEGGGGVFKTTNGGANWGQVNTGLTTTTIRTLTVDSASNVYAGSSGGGLFKTTNGGGNWNPLNNGLPTFVSVSAVALSSNASTIYMGTSTGRIYKSIDGGANWTISYETLTRTSFNSLIINPTSSAVYAGVNIQPDSLNDHEAFISKLNSNGSALVYSTYLGGSGDDIGRGIAVDSVGNAYVTGQTSSATFPLVAAFQSSLKGTSDAFVTKLNSTGDTFVYSTYLGGDGFENANAIATDSAGNAYVTGSTSSSNFPLANAFQSTIGDAFGGDAFATKFSSNGTLAYSTYLGGNGSDTGYGIAVDSSGNAYITGATASTNYPTANAIQPTSNGSDAFVTKLNSLGSGLVYSTYLGGSNVEVGRGIAVDSAANAYVTGFTNSTDFPEVVGALRTKSPLYKSNDGAANWSNDNYGLTSISNIVIHPTQTSTLYAGATGGVARSTNGGRTWSLLNSGLNNQSAIKVVIDPVTPSTIYAATYDVYAGSANGIYKSIDSGNTWTQIKNGMTNTSILSLVIDPVTPTTLYVGTYGGPIYKTVNGGTNWAPSGNPSISFAVSLAIDPSNPSTIFAADSMSGGGIFRSTDAGMTWQQVGFSQTGPYGSFVVINPLTPTTIYAGTNSGLFQSVDGGNTWINSQAPFGKPVFDPVDSSILYLLTSTGVLKSTNAGQNWTPMNKGLRMNSPISMAIDPTQHTTLYLAMPNANDNDAFVTKINQSGSAFVYSTLLGGNPDPNDSSGLGDLGFGIAVDPSGNAYVTGLTRSLDFPTTPDSYLPIPVGGSFVSKLAMSYLIGGQVLNGSSAPVSGAEVVLNDGGSLTTFVTGSDGSYQFSHLREGGSFTVSATKPQFTMAPPSQSFNNLTSNQTVNFVATASNASFFTLSGQVTNNGVALSGVTVTLSGSQPGTRTTDGNGNYAFSLAGGGNYTVTPSILGFTFTPPSQTFNNLSADQTAANFAATRQNFVVTNANEHGAGSLRQAILDANATVGADTIVFNIPAAGVQTINLQIALPEITDPVVIDATTQPGYSGAPLIELNGALTGAGNGFLITAGGCTIRGFAINRFRDSGISLATKGNNVIQANYIGIDPTGTLRRANNAGIALGSSSNNVIGGTTPATRNVISANTFHGITINGAGNLIEGNFIGTNAAGNASLGNGISGVQIFNFVGSSSSNNVIGGTVPGSGNLISGNQKGIDATATPTLIQGNLIGTDVTGTIAIGNGTGISATAVGTAPANTIIGGTVPGARNVISGNTGDGVDLGGVGSRLQGNFIGTDITGTLALGNGGSGVVAGTSALIGGTTPEARNIISGNGGFGNISLGSNNAGDSAVVQGNYIGTDVTGNLALTNPNAGISISSANSLIGGLVPGAQNVISGNRIGMQIGGSTSSPPTGNIVQGNIIGLNALGTAPLPNSQGGINFSNASNNSIGGTQTGAANKISFNGGSGVSVTSGMGNSIRGNSISANTGLGIDLFPIGVTSNDAGDTDTGANNLQNFPVLTSVVSNGGPTTIQGTLNSTPNTTFQIDFYSNHSCDPSGNGEGEQFFNSTTVTTAGDGNATINATFSVALASGVVITSTATDPSGNTSEFSRCVATPVPMSINDVSVNEGDSGTTNAVFTVTLSAASGLPVKVDFATANGTAIAPSDYSAIPTTTLTFAPGETLKTILVSVNGDTTFEPDETFVVNLSNAVNATITKTQGTGTILNDDTQGGFISFALASSSVSESAGSTSITVKRTGNLSGAATVDYATSSDPGLPCATISGVASPKCDFTASLGTLTFAAGENTKTINVLISQDAYVEGPETFTVSLSNQTGGAVLATPSTETITIIDDVTGPPTNPIDDAGNFVRQHYHDFLNREPDPSGLSFWTNQITSCGTDQGCIDAKRINVSAAFFLSIEFQQTGYLVERIYKVAYGDANGMSTLGGAHQLLVPIVRLDEFLADTQEIGQGVIVNQGNWQQQLENNKLAFTAEFVQRSRFTTAFPASMTPADFVDKLNTNAANPLSPAERDQLVTDLSTNAKTRAQVLRAVAEDPDLNSAEFNGAFVLMQYFGYLRRNPNDPQDTDYTGYDFWLRKLNQFTQPGDDVLVRVEKAEMVKAFIVSVEYRQRFGP
jgi:photosystem II stability/assembly factor-like uncharacterized protein